MRNCNAPRPRCWLSGSTPARSSRASAQKRLLDTGKDVVPQLQKILADGKVKPETAKTVQAIIETLDPAVGSEAAAQELDKKVHGLVSQIEFGDQTAIDNASKAIAELGRAAVGPLEKTLKDDKWKAETQQTLKALATRLAKAPDTQPATQPVQELVVDGVPADVLKLASALDSREFPVCRDAQEKLLDMGATVVPNLQKIIKEGNVSQPVQTRLQQVVGALSAHPLPCAGIRAVPAGILVRPIITPVAPPATQPAQQQQGQ